jgi:hypothetical protein
MLLAHMSRGAEGARKNLTDFKIELNDANNGVFLPSAKNVSNSAYHPGLHTDEYYKKVELLLSKSKNRSEAIEILKNIEKQLLDGTFM